MTDPIDDRLRRHAESWQQTLPHPREVDAAVLTARPPARNWILVAAAAASILAIVLAGLALRDSDKPLAPIGPGDVVPWKALPATHPQLPEQVTTTTAAPIPAGTPTCGPGDLELVDDTSEGAAGGSTYRTFYVDSTRPGGCHVRGFPTVALLGHGAPLDVEVAQARADNDPPVADVWISNDHTAEFTVSWAVSHHCPVVDNDQLWITFPGEESLSSQRLVQGFGRTTCDSDSRQQVRVTALHDPSGGEKTTTSPYDDLDVAGDLDLDAEPGERVRFTVTLTSPHDLDLAPCPDYAILTAAGEQAWGLNCADVPYRRDGQPYLPAGTPVTFAMEADAGRASTPKFLWTLTGTTHALGGALTVRGSSLPGSIDGTVEMGGGPDSTGGTYPVMQGIVKLQGTTYSNEAELAKGSFHFEQVPPGRYTITVSSPDSDGKTLTVFDNTVTVRDGETATPHVSLMLR